MNPICFKSRFDVIKAHKIGRLHFAKIMPMVKSVRVVVANHATVISAKQRRFDVGQVVAGNHVVIVNPYLASQYAVATLDRDVMRVVNNFSFSHEQ